MIIRLKIKTFSLENAENANCKNVQVVLSRWRRLGGKSASYFARANQTNTWGRQMLFFLTPHEKQTCKLASKPPGETELKKRGGGTERGQTVTSPAEKIGEYNKHISKF